MRPGRALAIVLVTAGLAACEPEPPYPGHARLLEQVAEFDLAELSEQMRAARTSEDEERLFVVALASYLVDPVRYQERFVQWFPARRAMDFVYEQLERRGLTPSPLWSFGELGRIAMGGSPEALVKLVEVSAYSEEPALAVVCDGLVRAFRVHTASGLRSFDAVAREERERAYRCFDALPRDEALLAREQIQSERGAAPSVELELLDRLPRPEATS